ncbi:ketodihydrosphingosine reductase [Seminavis robusta]|uniref:3-dehydrosphinganine reductase n=1 Tax=Seminavis robusta TaxID=568900 RepID=A0A9N8DK60_9STRA|nr:ketodihydrosphingosine reductase [Seminavis robusta]|eukprot:Sro166_g074220.1 ketodihydrosphingosine reductase (385) ;mRNA; f:63989-65143
MSLLKIAVAGIFAIPALLVSIVTAPLIAVLSLPSLALLCFQSSEAPQSKKDTANSPTKDHAIISGGSTGIGFSIAQDCVQRGMTQVTIMARTKSKLEAAVQKLEDIKQRVGSKTTISYRSVDVSDAPAVQAVAKELAGTGDHQGGETKYYLFCCAGMAYPGYFEHISHDKFAHCVNVNQLGTIFTVQAFLPHMTHAVIVLTSSLAGQVGVYGYTAYSPTKFALRGFAEVLHAELADNPQVHIQVAFPPDTDTPGFQEEEKTKPKETKLTSEDAGLSKPEDIANQMVKAALAPNPAFLVYFTLEGWMLSALTAGMSPVSTLVDAVTQVSLGGLFRLISLFYLNDWWRIIRQCAQERIDNNQEKPRPSAGDSANNSNSKSSDKKSD